MACVWRAVARLTKSICTKSALTSWCTHVGDVLNCRYFYRLYVVSNFLHYAQSHSHMHCKTDILRIIPRGAAVCANTNVRIRPLKSSPLQASGVKSEKWSVIVVYVSIMGLARSRSVAALYCSVLSSILISTFCLLSTPLLISRLHLNKCSVDIPAKRISRVGNLACDLQWVVIQTLWIPLQTFCIPSSSCTLQPGATPHLKYPEYLQHVCRRLMPLYAYLDAGFVWEGSILFNHNMCVFLCTTHMSLKWYSPCHDNCSIESLCVCVCVCVLQDLVHFQVHPCIQQPNMGWSVLQEPWR